MGPIIDLTHLFPWRILLLFCYSVAFFNIYRVILKDKFHPVLTFLTIFAARIITSVAFFALSNINILGYPAFALLCFIIILLMTEGRIYDKILVIVTTLISQFIGVIINASMRMILFKGKDYSEIYGSQNLNLDHMVLFLSECVIVLIIGILFSVFLKLYKRKRSKQRNSKLLIYMSAYPITHILFILIPFLFIPIELDHEYLSSGTYTALFVVFAITIIIDCAFPIIINHFEKIEEDNINKERKLVKNTMDYNQIMFLKEEKQEFRKIKHDFANIIATAKGFIEIGKPEKALAILSNTSEDLMGIAGFSVCSDETINTILYIKKQQAEKSNINIDIEIEENAAVLIDSYDLCRLMHNLLDNAINAVSYLDIGRFCKIFIEINNENVLIRTENKYSKSKRKITTDEHGNGTGIIKSIASKYDGSYTCEHYDGIWYTETIISNKDFSVNTEPLRISS